MNYLSIAQLASNAFNALGKPSKFDHDDIAEIKSGLQQLFNFCQQQSTQEQSEKTPTVQDPTPPASSKGSK